MRNPIPSTLAVIGAGTFRGAAWLERRFPDGGCRAGVLVLRLPLPELDAVLFTEELRAEARRDGIRLSVGLAEDLDGTSADPDGATEAYQRALELGGDLTVTAASLVPRLRRSA